MSERGVAVVAVDVADLCALHQTMRALHDLVHAPPAELDAHAALMAARGLSCAMLRRLGDVSAGPIEPTAAHQALLSGHSPLELR